MNIRSLEQELTARGIANAPRYSLKEASSFRIGGVCALAVFPHSAESLAMSVSLADAEGVPVKVMGKGSNTLFGDGYVNMCLVFTEGAKELCVSGEKIRCASGVSLVSLASKMGKSGLSGLEFACGIPGSVGGAVFMNAGAHGGCMADVISETVAYDRQSGKTVTVTEHNFGYRESVYKACPQLVCLEAEIKLARGEAQNVTERMRELLRVRREKQPLEYPSAGSYFKRPEGDFAGRLIEACGLKGASVGGAQVSEKHAGFIINRGGASFDDVMRLEELIKSKVYSETGIMLEREVEVVR